MVFNGNRVLVDTNVWVDNFDGVRRSNTDSAKSLDMALKREVQLLYAATSAKDVFYSVANKLKNEQRRSKGVLCERDAIAAKAVASSYVAALDSCATAVGIDSSDIWLARKLCKFHPDFEDCLIMAAAKRAKADYVLTGDKDFLRHSVVPALSPTDFITLMEA